MITPEPPAGSEHYREGWRHGYEQAAIDRERSTDAARPVPDTGQANEPDDLTEALNWLRSNWATNSRDWALDRREAAWYGVLVGWDCEEDHDHDDICGGTSGMDFVARRHVWAPVFVEALRRRRAAVAAAQSRATVQAPDVAAVVEAAKRLERHWYADCRTAFAHTPEGDLITAVRALLGVDTTPDRLAWISEAGETAAAQRQDRYQETACARRPAATSGDTDPLRASGRRFCEGDCSCGHDHERHGPEVPGCIECSCRITPEAPDA